MAYGLDRYSWNQGKNAKHGFSVEEEIEPSLVARGGSAVAEETMKEMVVRRLTPTECARLQGFPDWWCSDLQDDDFDFWREVWNEYARINNTKPKTDKAVREWMKHPHSDSAEYKMWGNGVALPCVDFVLWAIKEYENEGNG